MTSRTGTTEARSALSEMGSVTAVQSRKTPWAWAIATFFGVGFLKPGPGTWGSLAAAAIWYYGLRIAHLNGWWVVVGTVAGALETRHLRVERLQRQRKGLRAFPRQPALEPLAGVGEVKPF